MLLYIDYDATAYKILLILVTNMLSPVTLQNLLYQSF